MTNILTYYIKEAKAEGKEQEVINNIYWWTTLKNKLTGFSSGGCNVKTKDYLHSSFRM